MRSSSAPTTDSGTNRAKTLRTRCCSRSCSGLRFSPAFTRARRITGSNGFGRKSSAPISMHRTTLSASSTPLITITGRWRSASSPLMRSSTSMPSMPGMTRSSSTTSGGSSASMASAVAPSPADEVRCPWCSRVAVRSRRFRGSSSITKMLPNRPPRVGGSLSRRKCGQQETGVRFRRDRAARGGRADLAVCRRVRRGHGPGCHVSPAAKTAADVLRPVRDVRRAVVEPVRAPHLRRAADGLPPRHGGGRVGGLARVERIAGRRDPDLGTCYPSRRGSMVRASICRSREGESTWYASSSWRIGWSARRQDRTGSSDRAGVHEQRIALPDGCGRTACRRATASASVHRHGR